MTTKYPIIDEYLKPFGDRYIFSFPDDFYEKPEWIKVLNIVTQQKIKEAFNQLKITTSLLIIDLPINPTAESIPYYSLSGIEEILYNLFNGLSEKIKDELRDAENIFLYARLERSRYHVIPKLCLRLIIEGDFSEKFIDKLSKRLVNDMPLFIGGTGDIEYIRERPILYSLYDIFPEPENLILMKDLVGKIGLKNKLNNFLVSGITELRPIHILTSNIPFPDFEDLRNIDELDSKSVDVEIRQIVDDDYDDLDFS